MHVITRFIRGGADENTLISCNAQAEAGHDVILVYGEESHPDILAKLHPSVRPINMPEMVRPLSPASDFKATFAMRELCRSMRPDIVHTHTSKAGFVGRAGAWLARVPVIIHGVHILPFLNVGAVQKLLYLAAEKLLVPMTHAFVDVSEGMRQECLKHGIGTHKNHLVVASGMDVAAFQNASPIIADEFPELLPAAIASWDDAEIIVMAAAFEDRKRQPAFIAAFAKVAAARPKAVLLLAGAGPIQPEIEAAIAVHNLQDRVRVIGFRADIARWMRSAAICVLSSEREGLPRVIVQYVLAGRPVVATYLPGVEAVVKHGTTGYLVKSVTEMADPIITLLADDALRQQFATAAASLDLSAWGAQHMAAQLETLYQKQFAAYPGNRLAGSAA